MKQQKSIPRHFALWSRAIFMLLHKEGDGTPYAVIAVATYGIAKDTVAKARGGNRYNWLQYLKKEKRKCMCQIN